MATNKTRNQLLVGDRGGQLPAQNYYDVTEDIARSRQEVIELYHVPTSTTIRFKAFLTDFKDNYKSDYQRENVFGRMDPITTFKSIERSITIGFTVPSVDLLEAVGNMQKVNDLVSRLYPVYDTPTAATGGASTIKGAPIFKLKFGNLIMSPGASDPLEGVKLAGLPGVIGGFTYDPILEEGIMDVRDPEGWTGEFYPQSIRVSLEFSVLHDTSLGWNDDGTWRGGDDQAMHFTDGGGSVVGNTIVYSFPYNIPRAGEDRVSRVTGDPSAESGRRTAAPSTFARESLYQMYAKLLDDPSSLTEEQMARMQKIQEQNPADGIQARQDAWTADSDNMWGDQLDEQFLQWADLQSDLLKARLEIKARKMLGQTLGGWAGDAMDDWSFIDLE